LLQALLRRSRNGDRAREARPGPPRQKDTAPTIGLALGGGAARGLAHIGVIRTLVARGIVPDVIVGTSIGAVVGGCYAAGRLDALESWVCGLTARRVVGLLDVSLAGSGLIGGGRLTRRLEEALGAHRIDDLPLRFATIATEVDTGHEIWLTRGRLVDAMRASYALPGIFPAVHVGGRWLVDGALVNPVPVSAARALGARLVIAVNISAGRLGRGATIHSHGADEREELLTASVRDTKRARRGLRGVKQFVTRQFVGESGRPGISTVMVEAYNIMQDRITRARLAGDPPDVQINPRVGTIGWFEFHRAHEAIAAGAEAAERDCAAIAEAIAALA
jgi:NTE family protein